MLVAGVLLDLVRDLNILLGPHIRSIFRLALRVICRHALVLDVRHGAEDDHLRRAAWCIWERDSVLDLILLVVNFGENQDRNYV